MNRERAKLLRYLSVILLLVIALGVAGYLIHLRSLQPKTLTGSPSVSRLGWKSISIGNLGLKRMNAWMAEAPPRILAASEKTQLAWVLLDVCWSWPYWQGRPRTMLDPGLRDKVTLGPDHPFTRLVAIGKDAVPACIELLRPGTGSIDSEHQAAFVDLVLVCIVTRKDWREVVLGTSARRAVFPDASQLNDADAVVKWSVEGAAWVEWYDSGMTTPLPPLIQYQLDHPIGGEPEYYDQFGRPLYMDPKDLEGLPLPSGPLPQSEEEREGK